MFVGGGQSQEAVGRVAVKVGVDDDGRVEWGAAVDGDKVWGGWVGHWAAVNGGKVCLAWYNQQGFIEGRGGQVLSPCRSRGRALLYPRRY